MFDKEAEEYLKKDGTKAEQILNMLNEISPLKITSRQAPFILAMIRQVFQDAAEFGYNKVNEWHYVKDGDLPNTELGIADVTVAYINNYNVPKKLDCYYWDNEFLCDSTYGYKKVEDVYGKVYAWKYEDKLPELPKESEQK